MKKVVIWVMLVVLIGITACSPKLPEIAPNTTPIIPSSIPPVPTQPVITTNTTPPASTPPPYTIPEPVVLGPVVLASGPTLISEKARIQALVVSSNNQTSLTDSNGAFAFDLYRQIKVANSNFFYSPYSISSALSMVYAGAGGITADQMAKTLHFNMLRAEVPPAFNWLDGQLNQDQGTNGTDVRLNIANALWGQKDYEFRQAFLDTLAQNYGAGLRIQDFATEPEKSRTTINDWVNLQTENIIQGLLPSGSITPQTRLVLTNAIYFNAAWKYPFFVNEVPQKTQFYSANGSSGAVAKMVQGHGFFYTEGDNFQAVELPYEGDKLSMVILLPSNGKLKEFEDSLDYPRVKGIVSDLRPYDQVILTMPKFEFDSAFSLSQVLSALGMENAFSGNADFSGISSNGGLHIDEVVHKAYISVNETRTIAAAATGVLVTGAAPPTSQPIVMTVDHPFIFLIRDIQTGTILFVGRIVDQQPLKS